MQWYYANKGQRVGPVSQAEFEQLVSDGVITGETLVWRDRMPDWRPYSSVAGVPPALPGTSAAGTGYAADTPFHYGGFWIRFLAKFMDGMLIGFVSVIVNMTLAYLILGSPNYFGTAMLKYPHSQRVTFQCITIPLGIALVIAYECFFIRGWDATPGKMALSLKVLRPDGAKLSVGRIIGRYFAEWLSAIIFCIGYIMAGFDEEKRALHDRVCDTRVIRAE
jgi:uncharacterized RDD family membrane protein YckC